MLLITGIILDKNRKKKVVFLLKIQFYHTLAQFLVTLAQKTRQSTENLKKVFLERKVNRTKLSPKVCSTLADFEYSVKILAGNLPW